MSRIISNIWLSLSLLTMILILMIAGFSCSKSSVLDCFNSTGKITQTEREISEFHSIVLNDNVNLFLRQSDQNKLVLEAGSNLMSKIYTEVNDAGYLEIGNDNSCNWVRSYDKLITVYLDFVRLDTLEYRSIGNVNNEDTIRIDTLVIDVKEGAGTIELTVDAYKINTNLHYGTADIITSGKSILNFVYLAGFGVIDNRELQSAQVYATNKSSNDVYINATSTMVVEIDNIGNVYYIGSPVDVSLSGPGPGKLIALD